MSFIAHTQKVKINRLKKQLETVELRNKNLLTNNKELQIKIQSYESTISELKDIETEYNKRLDELKSLREKYKKVINDAYEMKKRYSKEMESLIKQFRNEL